jgi:type I restriction enzyme S subunit
MRAEGIGLAGSGAVGSMGCGAGALRRRWRGMAIAKRTILEALTRPELLAIAEAYELHVEDRRVRDQLIQAAAASRKVARVSAHCLVVGLSGYHSDAKVRGPGMVTGRYGTIGNVYFIWEGFWPLNTVLYVHDFKGTNIYYAFYLLTGVDFNKFSDKGAVPGVNRNDLHEEPVCRAPPALQRAFAERASLWLSLARDNEDQSRTLAELRDLLLPKLLSGELRIREAEKAVEAVL